MAKALAAHPSRTGRRTVLPHVTALLIGGGVAYMPWHWLQLARRVPPIHDISTDLEHPPEFVAGLPLPAGAPNPAVYGGAPSPPAPPGGGSQERKKARRGRKGKS